jgi:hypothetical protein
VSYNEQTTHFMIGYAILVVMENCYWEEWERFLVRRQMKSFACSFLTQTRPLLPILTQLMMIGLPLFKGINKGEMFAAILDTLGDEKKLLGFTRYLQGGMG